MSEFVDIYMSILEKLEEKITALKDNGNPLFSEVITGRKKAPKKYPTCFIYCDRVPMKAATTYRTHREMPFTIKVVGKKADRREGFEEVLRLLAKIHDMLEADRSLDGKADNLEIDEWEPEVERPRVLDRHETQLIVTFFRVT